MRVGGVKFPYLLKRRRSSESRYRCGMYISTYPRMYGCTSIVKTTNFAAFSYIWTGCLMLGTHKSTICSGRVFSTRMLYFVILRVGKRKNTTQSSASTINSIRALLLETSNGCLSCRFDQQVHPLMHACLLYIFVHMIEQHICSLRKIRSVYLMHSTW